MKNTTSDGQKLPGSPSPRPLKIRHPGAGGLSARWATVTGARAARGKRPLFLVHQERWGFQRGFMGFNEIFMGFYGGLIGISWDSMGFYGGLGLSIPICSVEYLPTFVLKIAQSWANIPAPWSRWARDWVGVSENSWDFSWAVHGIWMGFNGIWVGFHGIWMGFNGI